MPQPSEVPSMTRMGMLHKLTDAPERGCFLSFVCLTHFWSFIRASRTGTLFGHHYDHTKALSTQYVLNKPENKVMA